MTTEEIARSVPDLFNALQMAIRALNIATNFKVGDTTSYAIAAECERVHRIAAWLTVAPDLLYTLRAVEHRWDKYDDQDAPELGDLIRAVLGKAPVTVDG